MNHLPKPSIFFGGENITVLGEDIFVSTQLPKLHQTVFFFAASKCAIGSINSHDISI